MSAASEPIAAFLERNREVQVSIQAALTPGHFLVRIVSNSGDPKFPRPGGVMAWGMSSSVMDAFWSARSRYQEPYVWTHVRDHVPGFYDGPPPNEEGLS